MRKSVFSGHSAVVTGAGEGIGFEIARLLALSGAVVVLNDVDSTRAHNAATAIQKQGGHCIGMGGDVGDVNVVRGLVDEAVREGGKITIAVANAGQTLWNSFLEYTPEDFQRVLNVNLGGSFFLAQAAARHMRKQGTGGRILFMSSVTGHQAIEYLSAYSMTKAGLEMLARNLVVELSPFKITVNCVAPGATVTPRNLADDPDYEAHWSELSPSRRPAYPSDIARAALFLLAPSSDQITGQTLVVDGGWSAVSPTPRLDFVEQSHDE
ncbi:MAG: SDR family oxidoreductase [Rhodothermales bacterium]